MKKLNARQMGGKSQAGFTIIELVVVILLLGILTATALPRFLDVSAQAHDAVVNATFGGLQSGLALYRAGYVAAGEPTAGTAITTYGAGTLETNANGYPAGTDGGTAFSNAADCIAVYNGVLQSGAPVMDTSGSDITVAIDDDALDGATTLSGAVFDVVFSDTASAPYSANACYFIYKGEYTAHDDAVTGSDVLPVIVYEADGTLTSTDHTDAAIPD